MKITYTFLSLVFLCLPLITFGQQEELKQKCQRFSKALTDGKPLHMNYTLTVTGRGDQSGKESMAFDYYMVGKKCKSKMGTVQEVIKDGNLMLVVNHLDKLITLSEDTTQLTPHVLMQGLDEMLVGATSVSKSKERGLDVYTLKYPMTAVYRLVKVSFNASGNPVSSYSEFSDAYPEPYYSVEIQYGAIDRKWAPESGFPGISTFVVKKNGKYAVQQAWSSYQFYQNEKAKMKL